MRKQIIKLSTKHRVLSDYTALLVLETENDYARYGIKRTALADILVVGASGVELLQRAALANRPAPGDPTPSPHQPRPRDPRDRSSATDAPDRASARTHRVRRSER